MNHRQEGLHRWWLYQLSSSGWIALTTLELSDEMNHTITCPAAMTSVAGVDVLEMSSCQRKKLFAYDERFWCVLKEFAFPIECTHLHIWQMRLMGKIIWMNVSSWRPDHFVWWLVQSCQWRRVGLSWIQNRSRYVARWWKHQGFSQYWIRMRVCLKLYAILKVYFKQKVDCVL